MGRMIDLIGIDLIDSAIAGRNGMNEEFENEQVVDEVVVTANGFAALGLNQVAYIRILVKDDEPGFAIHGADGTFLTMAPSLEAAEGVIRSNDLLPVSVH